MDHNKRFQPNDSNIRINQILWSFDQVHWFLWDLSPQLLLKRVGYSLKKYIFKIIVKGFILESDFIKNIVLLLLGSFLTLIGTLISALFSRKTYSSNKIFEQRLELIQHIWSKFNNLKFEVANNYTLIFNNQDNHYESYKSKLETLLNNFRNEIDNAQIILDKNIIDGFRKLDEVYFLYKECEESNKLNDFNTKIYQILKYIEKEINENINKRTQKITLKLRT